MDSGSVGTGPMMGPTLAQMLRSAAEQEARQRQRQVGPKRGTRLARLRCQGCGAEVAGAQAIRWEMIEPGTEREMTLWLCGLECSWLFAW